MNTKSTVRALFLGILLGAGVSGSIWFTLLKPMDEHSSEGEAPNDSDAPLYWVAPMDDSYRRDKPGKSPMGMDLVPVYADANTDSATERSPGVVMISPQVQQNMGVKTAPVQVGRLDSSVTSVGTVVYDEDEITHIHPRVEGWIDTLHIKSQGDVVKAGQPLYTLYSPELVNAQEEYVLALKRNDRRLIEGAEQRLSALALNRSFIEKLKKTQQISQSVTFNAPQSGVVEALAIREGFFVQPGTTMMSIAKLESVWVLADIPEMYANQVGIGDSAEVNLDYLPGQTYYGEVDYIYPSLSAVTRTLKVRIALSNPDSRLKPNMFATVLVKPQHEHVGLLVPKSAVIRTTANTRVVLADDNGQFKSIAVKLGQHDSQFYSVTEGLLPGDNVVISAQFLIDAESSKDSDFMRMQAPDHQATTTGEIKEIVVNDESVSFMTIARGPIEKWGRGPATMSFALSPHIDPTSFSEGMKVTFTFVTGEEFVVIDMRPLEDANTSVHQHHAEMNHD